MTDTASSEKLTALGEDGTLNPRPEKVCQALFCEREFFDAHDLLQVKYEALRAMDIEDASLTQASKEYGLSRPTLYGARESFEKAGVKGLLAKKRGPRRPHKMTEQVVDYTQQQLRETPGLKAEELAAGIARRFGIRVHPRSVERAVERRVKKGRRCKT